MSLASRMQARAAELQKQRTEVFTIPGWRTLLAVELKPLGFTAMDRINSRNERERNETTRKLYNMADQIIAATMGFFEVHGDDREPIEDTWVSLASRLPDAPDGMTPRQALLFLLGGDQFAHVLFLEWQAWALELQDEVDEEVERDFGRTG